MLVRMKNFLNEFKAFAVRGNVLDLAIGVVIGGAFGQVTTSLVTNIITPPIGLLIGGFNFSTLAIPLKGTAAIGYGAFLQAILNFVIIAFALFILISMVNRFMKKQEPTPAENAELKVLTEIRDALQKAKV
jgi:large conductance mechanosensitive channel